MKRTLISTCAIRRTLTDEYLRGLPEVHAFLEELVEPGSPSFEQKKRRKEWELIEASSLGCGMPVAPMSHLLLKVKLLAPVQYSYYDKYPRGQNWVALATLAAAH